MTSFIKWVQQRLTVHGFSPGAIDGIDGPNTRTALKAFETKNDLKVDGIADDKVIVALRQEPYTPIKEVTLIPDRDKENTSLPVIKNPWPKQSGVPAFYGKVGTNQVLVEFPYEVYLAWDKTTRTKRFSCHKKVAESAKRVLQNVAQTYSGAERNALGLDLFGGSLNVRKMRGGSSYSMHSWGIALDFDPERNQLSWNQPKARLSHDDAKSFWEAWESEGWLSLGRTRNFDWMHVQAAQL